MSETIKTRQHETIKKKQKIWKLLSDSYKGGEAYVSQDHLFQYPRESTPEFQARKKRAVFLNHVQPLADIIAGFLYKEPVIRDVPSNLEYIIEKASKGKSLDAFMQNLAIQSLLYTCGVLVDAPIVGDDIVTMADRKSAGLNPYCVIYYPNKIRDFYVNTNLELEWILLDNTYMDKTNPLEVEKKILSYRLWTKKDFTDYKEEEIDGETKFVASNPIEHKIGEVPFIFVNWRDNDNDFITESIFEDIALLDRQMFNIMSYLDEMLAAGSFKSIFFPVGAPDDVPKEIIATGMGSLQVITFPMDASSPPFFAGADLDQITSFKEAFHIYLTEAFSKVGMNEDREKSYVQSGKARDKEFQKCESILRLGAEQLENVEKKIFALAAKWETKTGKKVKNKEIKIKYDKTFITEDIDLELSRLYQIHAMPYKEIQDEALKIIVRKVLTDLESKAKKSIDDAIEKKPDTTTVIVGTKNLQEQEIKTREQNGKGT